MPMDPDAQRVITIIALAARPSIQTLTPEAARAAYREGRRVLQPPPEPVDSVQDVRMPDGVALRVYRGTDAAAGRCLVYYHGGGWLHGDLDTHDGICRRLANLGRCRVVAVDYRMAPEHPFPAAVDDAAAALRWVVANAAELGVDPAQIAVGGDSAGGNLAAVLGLMGRDGTAPMPCFQLLLYPATDLRCTMPSYAVHTEGVTLTAEVMRWYAAQYLDGADPADWRASPLLADPTGAPPAFVLTVGYDPLCDEGVAYAKALDAAGVQTSHLHMPTQVHGFLGMGRIIRAADAAIDTAGAMLRTAWGG